jgi:hypothetical protein
LLCREFQKTLAARVAELKASTPGLAPALAIVQVGGREDSAVYIRMKVKAGENVCLPIHMPFLFGLTSGTGRHRRQAHSPSANNHEGRGFFVFASLISNYSPP